MHNLSLPPDTVARREMLGDSLPVFDSREPQAIQADADDMQAESVRRALVFARNLSRSDQFTIAERLAANTGEPLVDCFDRVKRFNREAVENLEILAAKYGVLT